METLETLKTRRSHRKYSNQMVSRETIEKIIDAGLYAPSGMGQQAVIILAITNKALRDQLSEMNRKIGGWDFDPFYEAPLVLVVLADTTRPTYIYDGSLVMGNLMNAAHSLGVDSCWIHRAKEEFGSEEGKAILKKLGISGSYEGIGHCILGYALDTPDAAPRKPNRVVWVE